MPTFLFFRGKVKIDFVRGADVNALKEKIKKHLGDGEGSEGAASDTGVPGHVGGIISIYKVMSFQSL